MDLQTRKLAFIEEFLRLQNTDIIRGLEEMLKKRKSEWFEKKLKPMDLANLHKDIDQAIDDSNNDNVILAEDLKAKYNK